MNAAPIQLQSLSFRRVSVEVDTDVFQPAAADVREPADVLDGVIISANVGIATREREDQSVSDYLLTLHVVIDNQPPEDAKAFRRSPYLVNIEAGAVIRVAQNAAPRPDIADIVAVNGASLLWSAIREQVSNLTARMPPGLVLLPTVQFQDLRKRVPNPPAEPVGDTRKTALRRVRKSKT